MHGAKLGGSALRINCINTEKFCNEYDGFFEGKYAFFPSVFNAKPHGRSTCKQHLLMWFIEVSANTALRFLRMVSVPGIILQHSAA
jgi:hypothetical protein